MVAGANIKLRIWKIENTPDNSVGGSVITGSVFGIYDARLQENPESQLLLQQGLEIVKTFTAIITPMAIGVQERYEAEVYAPYDHQHFGERMRIRNIRHSDMNPRDPRSYTMLSMSRSDYAHSQQ